jgi:hypothetical protein
VESELEKDFKTIAQLIAKHIIATAGSSNPNHFNQLSDLRGRVDSCWFAIRPPTPPAG